ncbi:MAG: hypothetical protein MUO54_16810 [Anaerolineales bacterium]|nr:hypothetical protein [Anaerolineales bacterium]
MKNRIGLILILIIILAGCQPSEPTPEQFTGGNSSLPATWTIDVSRTPTKTETPASDLGGMPSPTPNAIPNTPLPTLPTIPTQTGFSYNDLPNLTRGKEVTLHKIKMVSSDIGWAIGNQNGDFYYILYSRDGGQSWQDRTPPIMLPNGIYQNMDNLISYFYDENTAWVLIDNTKDRQVDFNYFVWKTEDGGLTWIPSNPLPFPLGQFQISPGKFSFINSDSGWLLVQTGFTHMHDLSYLFSTRDGGITWHLVNRPGNSMIEVLLNTGIAFGIDKDGWVTKDELGGGTGPFIEQTRDGGKTWESIYLPPLEGISWEENRQSCQTIKPVFTSSQTGLILVQCFPYNEESHGFIMDTPTTYIFATSDWGESWQAEMLPSPAYDLVFIDFLVGYAMGKDHYQTRNGGADWFKIKTVTWQGQFNFINATEGWVVARRGDDIALVHTTDGGLTYQQITPVLIP